MLWRCSQNDISPLRGHYTFSIGLLEAGINPFSSYHFVICKTTRHSITTNSSTATFLNKVQLLRID